MRKPFIAVILLLLLSGGAGSSAVVTRALAQGKPLTAIQQAKRLGPKPTPSWYWRWLDWRLGEGYAKGRQGVRSIRPRHAPRRIPTWAWGRLHFLLLAREQRRLADSRKHGKHATTTTQTGTTSTAQTTTTTSTTTTTQAGTTTTPTTTTTSTTTTTPTTTTTSTSPGWTNLVRVDFSAEPDGFWPSTWCRYSGFDQVFKQGYYNPSHVYVKSGLLHLVSKYDSSGPNGAAWYTGGFSFKGSTCGGTSTGPFGFSAVNSQMTVRMRLVESGTSAMGHRNVIFWPDNGQYYQGGEEDMWESDVGLSNASLFLHYGTTSPQQVAWSYPTSWRWTDWHTYRFQNLDGVISIYVDDMTTPIHVYTCTSTTCPNTTKHWVMQQQMHAAGGTPAPNSDQEDWQVSSIVIDKAS